MKKAKKLTGILLLIAMLFMIAAPAMATQTGSLTINGTTNGKTYDLYKVLDLTQSGDAYSYTVNKNFEAFSITEMGENNLVAYIGTLDSNSDAISELAQELVKYAVKNKITPAESVTATDTTATANLDYGYYVMNPAGGSEASGSYATMFSLNTLSGNDMTINVKATYPTVEKKVDGAAVNEASIGDVLTFTLTSKVPDLTGYAWYKFVAVDTLSTGLTYKEVKSITIGSTTLNKDTNDYTVVSKDNGQTIRFIFSDFVDAGYTAGDAIVITYTATLNEQAVVGTSNGNTAKLEYSNDPSYTQDKDYTDSDFGVNEPKGESANSTTETYTTSLTIQKQDGAGKALTGAAFRISGDGVTKVVTTGDVYVESTGGTYWKLTDGTYTTTDPNTEGIDTSKYASTDMKYAKENKTTIDGTTENVNVEAFVNENGQLTFAGLGAGTYTISEIVTPDGYNSIPDFTVTISFDANDKTFSATSSNSTSVSSSDGNLLSMFVVNQSGSTLPSTGGIGTTIFYVVGGVLVVGAGVLLITRKRMSVEK